MIQIVHDYKPSKLVLKIIDIMCSRIRNSHLKDNYNFKYKTQIYDLKIILAKIFYCLYHGTCWRCLGDGWNNVYQHYTKLNKLKLFKDTYAQLLNKYLTRNKKSLKIVSVDTSFIYNKYGSDTVGRNKFAKNKKCSKIFLVVDNKRKPIYFNIHKGNIHDSKLLDTNMDQVIETLKDRCDYFLADTGFCSVKTREIFHNNNIIPLIPKNIRNTKKDFKMDDLTWDEKKKIIFTPFTESEKTIYNRRIIIENFFANFKQIFRFNARYDRHDINFKGFMYLHFSTMLS